VVSNRSWKFYHGALFLINNLMKKILIRMPLLSVYLIFISALFIVSVSFQPVHAAMYSSLSGQLDFGETSENVTNLQIFLAANPAIYPEGKVTGYFGSLTRAAVVRFQNQYGIDPVGRVGPLTLNKINNLITTGGWNGIADVSGPRFYSVNQALSSRSATFTWITDENATAKIFYYTDFIKMNEGDSNSVGFGSTNGFTALNDGVARTSQQVTITGLQPNTLYHYVVVATDQSGNVSVWNPNTTFKTTN
jgi:peptidoglycan hydrolase-like protein with peptidoglycan-binding domain